jgi:hypothetical protein
VLSLFLSPLFVCYSRHEAGFEFGAVSVESGSLELASREFHFGHGTRDVPCNLSLNQPCGAAIAINNTGECARCSAPHSGKPRAASGGIKE